MYGLPVPRERDPTGVSCVMPKAVPQRDQKVNKELGPYPEGNGLSN